MPVTMTTDAGSISHQGSREWVLVLEANGIGWAERPPAHWVTSTGQVSSTVFLNFRSHLVRKLGCRQGQTPAPSSELEASGKAGNPVPSDLTIFPLGHPVSEPHTCNCRSHAVTPNGATASPFTQGRAERAEGARDGTARG